MTLREEIGVMIQDAGFPEALNEVLLKLAGGVDDAKAGLCERKPMSQWQDKWAGEKKGTPGEANPVE
jgi:hypothetical protein